MRRGCCGVSADMLRKNRIVYRSKVFSSLNLAGCVLFVCNGLLRSELQTI